MNCNTKSKITLFLLLTLTCGSFFEIHSEENSVTNITQKRATWAVISNTIIPGLGYSIINKDKPAFGFYTCEAFFDFVGFLYLERYRNYYEASHQYARTYAGVKGKGMEDWYWDLIGNKYFSSSSAYNDYLEMNGEYDKKITDPDLFWGWVLGEMQTEYNDMRKVERKEQRSYRSIAITFFSCAILNRVISTTGLIFSIRKNRKLFENTSLEFRPNIGIISRNSGIYAYVTLKY